MKMIMENWKDFQNSLYLGEHRLVHADIRILSELDQVLAEGAMGDLVKKGKELVQSKIGDKILAAFIKAQAKGAKATGTVNDFVEKHMPALKDPRVVAALAVLLAGGAAAAGSPSIAKAIATKGAFADIRGISAEIPEMLAGLMGEGIGREVLNCLMDGEGVI